jgi:hypothetical protein
MKIGQCHQAEREHDASCRQFAHVFHKKNTICVTPEFYELPASYRLGILLHECGHLSFNRLSHTEKQADEEGGALAGVKIYRRRYRNMNNLEYVKRSDHGKALDFLRRNLG